MKRKMTLYEMYFFLSYFFHVHTQMYSMFTSWVCGVLSDIRQEQNTIFEKLSNNNTLSPETRCCSHAIAPLGCCAVLLLLLLLLSLKATMRWLIRILFQRCKVTHCYCRTSTKYDPRKEKKKTWPHQPMLFLLQSSSNTRTHNTSPTSTHIRTHTLRATHYKP